MSELAGPIARIFLRYFAGALIAKAGLSIDPTDPDIASVAEATVGLMIGVVSEGLYAVAHKRGWNR